MFNDECDNKHKTIATLYELVYYIRNMIEKKDGIYLSKHNIELFLKYLEELQTKREELKVYKKALELMAKAFGCVNSEETEKIINMYLQKAREE